jgi:hypothetical protein
MVHAIRLSHGGRVQARRELQPGAVTEECEVFWLRHSGRTGNGRPAMAIIRTTAVLLLKGFFTFPDLRAEAIGPHSWFAPPDGLNSVIAPTPPSSARVACGTGNAAHLVQISTCGVLDRFECHCPGIRSGETVKHPRSLVARFERWRIRGCHMFVMTFPPGCTLLPPQSLENGAW